MDFPISLAYAKQNYSGKADGDKKLKENILRVEKMKKKICDSDNR